MSLGARPRGGGRDGRVRAEVAGRGGLGARKPAEPWRFGERRNAGRLRMAETPPSSDDECSKARG
eukprot:3334131-Alexandrium_andersonii.AAC.1